MAINRLKDPPTWLKVATTLENPPTPTHSCVISIRIFIVASVRWQDGDKIISPWQWEFHPDETSSYGILPCTLFEYKYSISRYRDSQCNNKMVWGLSNFYDKNSFWKKNGIFILKQPPGYKLHLIVSNPNGIVSIWRQRLQSFRILPTPIAH